MRPRSILTAALAAWCFACGSPEEAPLVAPPPQSIGEAHRIAVGRSWSCVINDARRVVCRGVLPVQESLDPHDARGDLLGAPPPDGYDVSPRAIPELDGAIEIVGASGTLCARDGASRVRCWGELLGRSSLARMRPSEVVAMEGASAIALSSTMLCGLFAGHVRCWVSTAPGEDDAASIGSPVTLAIDHAIAIAGGEDAVCIVRQGGPVTCVLGEVESHVERPIEGSVGAESVTVSHGHACFVRERELQCAEIRWVMDRVEGMEGAEVRITAMGAVCLEREGRFECPDSRPRAMAAPRRVHVTAHDPARGGLDWVLDRSGALTLAREGRAPVQIAEVTDIAMADHACVRRADDRVMCWGNNLQGQAGDLAPPSATPSRIQGLPAVRAIAALHPRDGARAGGLPPLPWLASDQGGCALDLEGRVWCWDAAHATPRLIGGPPLRSLVGPGCGAAEDGSVHCVCDGALRAIDGLDASRALAGGAGAILAADRYGTVRLARLVDPRLDTINTAHALAACDVPSPIVELTALRGATELALGGCFACGLVRGRMRCAGHDPSQRSCPRESGPLGDDAAATFDPPILAARDLVAGAHHACARTGGRFTCWGHAGPQRGDDGRMRGATAAEATTTLGADVARIAIAPSGTCVWSASGPLRCTALAETRGRALLRMDDGWREERREVSPIHDVRDVALGEPSCALVSSGEVWCWGEGPRGDGTTALVPEPIEVDFAALALP